MSQASFDSRTVPSVTSYTISSAWPRASWPESARFCSNSAGLPVMVARVMRLSLELHHGLVGAQAAALLGLDAHVAVEGPAAVVEIEAGGVGVVGLHARVALGDHHLPEIHGVGLVVDLRGSRIERDRLLAGAEARGQWRRERARAGARPPAAAMRCQPRSAAPSTDDRLWHEGAMDGRF